MSNAVGNATSESHRDTIRLAALLEPLPPPRHYPLPRQLRGIAHTLERCRQLLLRAPATQRLRISEWMLDNDYVVEQAIEQVAGNLPRHFFRQLPSARLRYDGASRLRVAILAEALLDFMEGHVWPQQLEGLVRSFDQRRPLSMGELWALPTALRWVLLDRLSQLASRIEGLIERDAVDELTGRSEASVAQIIVSLRAVDGYDWRTFFESTSAVERILGRDPAGVYGQMDFSTRDRYRRRIEQVARYDPALERRVARQAIALARAEKDGTRQRHVGFFLLDDGLVRLEQALDLTAPTRIRIARFHRRHGPWFLLGTVTLGSLALASALLLLGIFLGAPGWLLLASGLLALVPAGNAAMSLVTFMSSQALPPQVLPRLDFERRGIPLAWRTLVVVPALVGSRNELERLFADLELNRLRNPDPHLSFALLADFADADHASLPTDHGLIDAAVAIVEDLNTRHGGGFSFFYRPRQWNPVEGCWMAWERKRGKLHELNRWLRGAGDTSFAVIEGRDTDTLRAVKLVLTLDADTVLPRGSAARLAGTLAHPLNHAEFDPSGRLTAGYSILQPRVEVDPRAANRSRFSRIYAGETGLDLYTNASSDVYQDLFSEGIYAGKGLYDVDAFERSLADRAPENSLLSHDLFEGVHGRAALVSDVTVLEDFPPSVVGYMRRLHRWVRGDWQLIPWLAGSVPRASGGAQRNRLAVLDRYKIFDNLRRSLVAPAILALLFLGWLGLPRASWLWTLVVAASFGAPVVFAGLARLVHRVRGAARAELVLRLRSLAREVRPHAGRWLLALVFLPYEVYLSLDAVGRTLTRVWITRRNLLEWTTAAHLANGRGGLGAIIRQMLPSQALVGVGAALLWLRPTADPVALALMSAWLASPLLAFWLSRETEIQADALGDSEKMSLRRMARRTWLFYEQFVGPDDHWLPPDNYQEDPRSVIAHRTSPTNVGMLLLSTVAAHDLGYVSTADLQSRLHNTFDSLDRLQRHRGHWLNWYDTHSLEPLTPRYVSTVDSGNLAAALLVVAASCGEAARTVSAIMSDTVAHPVSHTVAHPGTPTVAHTGTPNPGYDQRLQRGVADTLGVLVEVVREIGRADATPDVERAARALDREIAQSLPLLEAAVNEPATSGALIASIGDLAVRLAEAAAPHQAQPNQAQHLAELHIWLERLSHHFELITRQHEMVAAGEAPMRDLATGLLALERRALASVGAMRFNFLYDRHRELFHIGFNLDAGAADPNFYDLLASESRIASLIAIAKGDAPERHWLHLGRPLTRVGSRRVLLSWGATMFEYLMPLLFMPSPKKSLLHQSCASAVRRQRRFARRYRIPWGISESAFFQFDAQSIYQYRAFGVTGLGLKRDIGDRLVVAPYATFLALPLAPHAALENLDHLRELNMLGRYGWYEAVDFGLPKLRPAAHQPRPVRSYMAHHQGMILAAIDNVLFENILSTRLMADPRLHSTVLLLHERRPEGPALRTRRAFDPRAIARQPTPPSFSWRVAPAAGGKQCHVLSNGRLSVIATSAGGLGVHHLGRAVTRFSPDSVGEPHGGWFHLQDLASGAWWTTGEPNDERDDESVGDRYEMTASPSEIRFHRRRHGIASRLEMTVLPSLDLLVERLILINESARARRIAVTSYHEIVLAPTIDDRRHPAFNKLFVTAAYEPRSQTLVFARRPCAPGPDMPSAGLRILAPSRAEVSWCASREALLGRHGSLERPAALAAGGGLIGTAGPSLDPIAAFRVELELPPRTEIELALLCALGASDAEVTAALAKVPTLAALPAAFDRSRLDNEVALHDLEIAPADLPLYQQLHARLTYPSPSRARVVTRFPRPRLWNYGISGDCPILLLETAELDHLSFVRQLLLAHAWWRRQGIEIDLVVVDQLSHGYEQPLRDRLSKVIADTGGTEWVGRRGGLHLLSGGVVGNDLPGLEQSATVVLRAGRGTLSEQLQRLDITDAELPAFVPSLPGPETRDIASALERPTDLLLDNGIGGFSVDGHEYIMHLEPGQRTPAPWSNVLANPEFGCLVSESSLGCTWALNSHENRLTPWRNDPVLDEPSEVVYLRDEETGEVWSATANPGPADSTYQIHHAQGHSVYRHIRHGLDQRLRVFVAPDEPVKLVVLQIENLSPRPRRVTVTYYCEWVLGTLPELSARHVACSYAAEHSCLLAWNPSSDEFAERVAFLASSEPTHGLTADRREFLGGGGLRRPSGLRRIGLSGNADLTGDPCAALQVHLDLAPGASRRMHFVLGQGRDRAHALALAERFREPAAADTAFDQTMDFWSRLRAKLRVETPDLATNLMLNGWLVYQTVTSRLWGRSSLYQSGGAFGFRDQLQDVLSLLLIEPEMARDHILEACARQFKEGDVLHWWHPPAGRGLRSRCSDDLLWLPWVTAAYVESTGDLEVLDHQIPFLEGPALGDNEVERYDHYPVGSESASVYEHCLRALDRGATEGRHGLPRIGASDWNDGLSLVGHGGQGESVWLAWFLIATLERFAELCHRRADSHRAETLRRQAARLRESVRHHAWDGAWYCRAFYDDGTAIGSRHSDECQIDLIAQAWSVLARGDEPERTTRAMESAFARLVEPEQRLIKLLQPPFDRGARNPGYIKGYPPGIRENGGQYTHAAVWGVWAWAELGQIERVGRLWRDLLPPNHAQSLTDVERYRVEPYVAAADIYSAAPWTGRGGWTWYTGSAAWLYRLGVERLLGLVKRGDRLELAPALPPEWTHCQADLRHGQARYRIRFDAPSGGTRVTSVHLDGIAQKGTSIELDRGPGVHEVVVVVAGTPGPPGV